MVCRPYIHSLNASLMAWKTSMIQQHVDFCLNCACFVKSMSWEELQPSHEFYMHRLRQTQLQRIVRSLFWEICLMITANSWWLYLWWSVKVVLFLSKEDQVKLFRKPAISSNTERWWGGIILLPVRILKKLMWLIDMLKNCNCYVDWYIAMAGTDYLTAYNGMTVDCREVTETKRNEQCEQLSWTWKHSHSRLCGVWNLCPCIQTLVFICRRSKHFM